MYYFPNPFKLNEKPYDNRETLGLTVNSGKNAIRLGLQSFQLPKGSTVAVPAFSCNEVVNAVLEENLLPFFVDLKQEGSFWAKYNEQIMKEKNVKVIIITHLYGFLHPDTESIIELCNRNSINIIHDAAQSFGIDESKLKDGPIVYSFGPGKSTTAARGGELVNLNTNVKNFTDSGRWDRLEAELFFKSRIYGSNFGKFDILKWKVSREFMTSSDQFRAMSLYQREMAKQAKHIAKNYSSERQERYRIISNVINQHKGLRLAYNEVEGLAFKIVLYINNGIDLFIKYLIDNQVPFCRLADSMNMNNRSVDSCDNFMKSYKSIIEISTERSIPMEEIKRIASVLEKYKNEN